MKRQNPWNPPHVIALRLILWPVLKALNLITFVVIAAGWGLDEAHRAWWDMI